MRQKAFGPLPDLLAKNLTQDAITRRLGFSKADFLLIFQSAPIITRECRFEDLLQPLR